MQRNGISVKRVLCFVLIILFAIWPAILAESAESEDFYFDNYTYRMLDDGTAEITGYTGEAEELIVPNCFGETRVTSIGPFAFSRCLGLNVVQLQEGLTNIGERAFLGCENLKRINLPEGLLYIGEGAFTRCTELKEINLPATMTEISAWTFAYCEKLENIKLPEGLTSIGDIAFGRCLMLNSIELPDGLMFLGSQAFSYCESLTEITIPDSITKINTQTFFNCTNLRNVYLPFELTSIDDMAFAYCESLEAVPIPESVTEIGWNAFFGCTSLNSMNLPASLTEIAKNSFDSCGANLIFHVEKNSYAERYCFDNDYVYRYANDISFANDSFEIHNTSEEFDYEVGSIVVFGTYEQDNDFSNGKEPIEWIVFDEKNDGSLILISKYALNCKQYNKKVTAVTWETCSLREWLNTNFYAEAFNSEEQAKIIQMSLENEDNPNYGTTGGNVTQDNVWLLSISELADRSNSNVYVFFRDDDSRMCTPTKYAIAQGAYQSDYYDVDSVETCFWWLRSPGLDSRGAAVIIDDGSVFDYGRGIDFNDICVRPVVCIMP